MEAKHERDGAGAAQRKPSMKAASGTDDDEVGAPSSDVVALRHGYNQTYVIRSSDSALHDVLFRCGNWCYGGLVDLGSSQVELADVPVVIPALQKQQASLQYLCEWKAMPSTSPYAAPLETLYDAFDFIGTELASKRVEEKLMAAAEEHGWIDTDSDKDGASFFELQSGGFDCFDDIDLVASKTFVRGLVMLVVYYQRSFYVVLQEGEGEQPLLDVRFPDMSTHLQGVHLRTYRDSDCTNMKKLTLWQATKPGKGAAASPPKPLKVQCKDVSGTGYTQTFLIRRTPPTADGGQASLREVLFRFGNWCYNGHVDLGPKLELADIPVIIPMLRRQQSALVRSYLCFARVEGSSNLAKRPSCARCPRCRRHRSLRRPWHTWPSWFQRCRASWPRQSSSYARSTAPVASASGSKTTRLTVSSRSVSTSAPRLRYGGGA